MSKMSELSQVLDEMIACGEGMIKAANAIKDIFSSTEEAPEKKESKSIKKATKVSEPAKAKETPEPTYTKEDVRAVLASKSAAGLRYRHQRRVFFGYSYFSSFVLFHNRL